MTAAEALLTCSFCGKDQHIVRKLIAGPGVYICDECVGLCVDIIDEELTDDGLQAVARLSTRVDQLVDALRADGVPWEDIARALRKKTDDRD